MKTIAVRLPEDLHARIESLAQRRCTSKSAVIRDAIEKMLARDEARQPGTRLDLIADLVGCVKGPGDLSWNKRHLDEFGAASR